MVAKGTAAVARATVVAAKEMVAAGAAAVVRARRVAATGKEDTAAEERARAARGLPPSRLSKGVRRQKGVGAARGGGGGGEREGGCGGDGGVDAATQHDRAPTQVPWQQRKRAVGLQQRRVARPKVPSGTGNGDWRGVRRWRREAKVAAAAEATAASAWIRSTTVRPSRHPSSKERRQGAGSSGGLRRCGWARGPPHGLDCVAGSLRLRRLAALCDTCHEAHERCCYKQEQTRRGRGRGGANLMRRCPAVRVQSPSKEAAATWNMGSWADLRARTEDARLARTMCRGAMGLARTLARR